MTIEIIRIDQLDNSDEVRNQLVRPIVTIQSRVIKSIRISDVVSDVVVVLTDLTNLFHLSLCALHGTKRTIIIIWNKMYMD